MLIFGGGVGNFKHHFLSHFFFNLKNVSARLLANILKYPVSCFPQLLHFGLV